ncbi:MAG: hypothetical protein AAGG11_11715 [Pseudomonadota bacterium]
MKTPTGACLCPLALLVLLACTLGPRTLLAAERLPGSPWQTLALELIGARSELGNTPDRGQYGTGEVIDGIRDGVFNSSAEVDTSAATGLRLDRYFKNRLMVGLMAHWHFPVDWDITARTPGIQTITNTFTNVERAVVLARLGYRWPLDRRWNLMVAAALGVAQHRLETVYTERAVPGIREETRLADRRRDANAAWALELGVERSLGSQLTLGLLYRYLDSGDLSVRASPGSSAKLNSTLRDHLFALSLGWRRR